MDIDILVNLIINFLIGKLDKIEIWNFNGNMGWGILLVLYKYVLFLKELIKRIKFLCKFIKILELISFKKIFRIYVLNMLYNINSMEVIRWIIL